MQPENQTPKIEVETKVQNTERAVDQLPNIADSEDRFGSGVERFEQKSELSAAIADVGIATSLPSSVVDDQTSNSSDDNFTIGAKNPVFANDDDLIEKEWVDRAKKIVVDTKNDPYLREKQVNKLQSEYIEKRYGRKLGVTEQ